MMETGLHPETKTNFYRMFEHLFSISQSDFRYTDRNFDDKKEEKQYWLNEARKATKIGSEFCDLINFLSANMGYTELRRDQNRIFFESEDEIRKFKTITEYVKNNVQPCIEKYIELNPVTVIDEKDEEQKKIDPIRGIKGSIIAAEIFIAGAN